MTNELPRIFLAPRSGEQSAKNFEKTIEGGYRKSDVIDYLSSSDRNALKAHKSLMVWGNKPSLKSRWEKMKEDDWVLFYVHGKIKFAGKLLYKTHNKELADALWGPQKSENGEIQSWEFVYFLKDVKPTDIDYRQMANYAGYSGSIVQGFQPYEQKGVKKILEKYGSVENYFFNMKMAEEIDFKYQSFKEATERAALLFSDKLVIRFLSSLLTKPFVILTGLSGSGKTKLALSFVQWLCQDKSQYALVPVGADWTNREPLLGFPNALNQNEYIQPDSGVLALIQNAKENDQLPYFLILDEMNLSHVERYFADFLSVMESNESIHLHSMIDCNVPNKIDLPENLFIIGTVNIDETTYMFSPKVLDRANTIEFRVDENELTEFLKGNQPVNMSDIDGKGSGMASNFVNMAQEKSPDSSESINRTLVSFFSELKKAGAEFGYRTANEILILLSQLGKIDSSLTQDEKLDIAVMQKLLPKLHGSRRKLEKVLFALSKLCLADGVEDSKVNQFLTSELDASDKEVLFPISLEKIQRMYQGAIDHGFASYAEA